MQLELQCPVCFFSILSVCLSVCLSVYLPVGRSVCRSVCPSVRLSGLSVCLAALLSSLQFPSLDAQLRVISTLLALVNNVALGDVSDGF